MMRGYAVCTVPRSGSSFLGLLLRSTGQLGRPQEYFNAPAMRKIFGPDYPDDPERQLQAVTELGATANRVYGVKVFAEHFDRIKLVRWTERLPSLSFVHLERRDRLGQAISFARAMQTQQWWAGEAANREPSYDGASIDKALRWLGRGEARWRYYFARNGLPMLTLVYEELAASPQAAAESVARHIGLDQVPTVDSAQIAGSVIQRDVLSDEWRARFLAESRDLATFDEAPVSIGG